jgi:hypothetical protein
MERIAGRLGDFDVVCLQEVWVRTDRTLLVEAAAAAGLPHWRSFVSGRRLSSVSLLLGLDECVGDGSKKSGFGIGSGLLILSRYPIIRSTFRLFRLCGKVQRFYQHGES